MTALYQLETLMGDVAGLVKRRKADIPRMHTCMVLGDPVA